MSYPPNWRRECAPEAAIALIRANPFAHLVTSHSGLHSTPIPFVLDTEGDRPVRLRGHLHGQNPQVQGLGGQDVLVTFSGRSSYVSPHWRTNCDRAGTIDYEQVQVRGRVKLNPSIEFFVDLVNDLAAAYEPLFAELGDYPIWHSSMAPAGYIERLFPAICAFEVEISSVDMTSKLHQSFPDADRRSIADHLEKSSKEDSQVIAAKIRATLSADG